MNTRLLLLAGVIALVLWWYTKKKPYAKVTHPLSPATTVFAFDLHSVVLIPDRLKITRLLWHNFFKAIPFSLLINPRVWYEAYKLYRTRQTSEEIFTRLQQKYPTLTSFKDLLANLIAAYSINPHMIPILKKLKEEGYPLYILSNIWAKSLEELYKEFPLLNQLFDGAYIPSKDIYFAPKPSRLFYEDFRKYLAERGHSNKHIILVDNEKATLKKAQKAGLQGILFTSVESFRSLLEKYMQA